MDLGFLEKGVKLAVQKAKEDTAKTTIGAAKDIPGLVTRIVSPIAQSETDRCTNTPPWFVQGSEYDLKRGTFKLLINGKSAFREIHDAIDNAKHSVNIICWGFQPSMYFKRRGAKGESIGELLERKGGRDNTGVKINILCYANNPGEMPVSILGLAIGEANTPGQNILQLNDRPGTASDDRFFYNAEWFARYDEKQSVGSIAKDAAIDTAETAVWCVVGTALAPESGGAGLALVASEAKGLLVRLSIRSANLLRRLHPNFDPKPKTKNIHFAVRGFGQLDKAKIALKGHDGKDVGVLTSAALAYGPTHHQKVVIVDYEDPDNAVAFVMGHNMLDEYWDDNDHSYKRHPGNESYLGRNGTRPREDFSSRVTGPVIGDLFNNFAAAWQLDTNETLRPPPIPFSQYKPRPDALNLLSMAQVTRTQVQAGKYDIRTAYTNAVNNATQYLYIENQYFRWPELADKICAHAKTLTKAGRDPAIYGPLYAFVITNADPEAIGRGTVNTERMLDKLGRSDTLPEVARQQRVEDSGAERSRALQDADREMALQNQLKFDRANATTPRDKQRAQDEIDASKKRQKVAEQCAVEQQEKLAKQQVAQKDSRQVIEPEERPGLKVHVCTLVAPDTPGRSGNTAGNVGERAMTRAERIDGLQRKLYEARSDNAELIRERQNLDQLILQHPDNANLKKSRDELSARIDAKLKPITDELNALKDPGNSIDWVDVYVHAKLMIIDDTYMTLGSANINQRSMDTDSELNISHANHLIAQPARQFLWGLHTKGQSGAEVMNKKGMWDAYKTWEVVMTKNKGARKDKQSPTASLVEFFSATQERTNWD